MRADTWVHNVLNCKLHRLRYTVFLSGICSLPVTRGFCVQVKSICGKEKPFLYQIIDKIIIIIIIILF